MTGFEVNSREQSRFETYGAHTEATGEARYWAEIFRRHLPLWLDEEIRQNRLSILDWACGEGERVDSLRTHFPQSHVAGIDRSAEAIHQARLQFGSTHFVPWDVSAPLPVTFDILVTASVQDYETPWLVLSRLGTQVARHVVMLVPYAECRPGQMYRFDESTIGTRIEPDFFLSSSQVIRGEYGARIMLVYSRPPYFPQAGAVFGEVTAAAIVLPDSEPAMRETPAPEGRPEGRPRTGGSAPLDDPNPIETVIQPELQRARSIAIVACAIPFSSSLNQRPICCAKYLAGRGATVLFVELWQCPEQAVHRTGEEVYPGVFAIPFYAFQSGIHYTFQDNLEAIAAAAPPVPKSYVCTLPERKLVDAARVLEAAGFHIHYDIMDDWGAFFEGDREMTHWFSAPVEMEMVALADTVTAVSRPLVEKFQRLRGDIAEVRNGYQPSALECGEFAAARTPLEFPKVVGYFGHFADAWFDWDMLFAAARGRPDLEFELIGYGLSDHSLLRLHGFPNIHYVGLVPQKDLHRHAEKWWAAMIPFQSSTLSAAVDPLKVYEYLHFGLPVVAAGIPSIADFPLVQMASDGDSFVAALDRLPDRPSEQSLAEVAEFLKSCVWEARLATLDGLLARHSGLEDRETRKAVLHADATYWQSKAVETEKQLERRIRLEEAERKRRDFQEQERLQAAAQEQHRLDEARRSEQEHWRLETAALTRQLDEQTRVAASLRNSLERLQHRQDAREAEVAAHQAALRSQVQYWQEKASESGRQLSEERGQHREEVLRFRTVEEVAASEIRVLQSRAAAGADETAHLRRLTSDLLNSWSWKVTAPLRFLTKPLFTAPAEPMSPGAAAVSQTAVPAAAVSHPAPHSVNVPDALEAVWEELRRAQSVAIIPCAVPFRSAFNQRPISYARHLSDRGFTVLYVSWQWADGKELPPDGEEVYPRIFHLSLATFQASVERIAALSQPPTHSRFGEPNPQPLYLCSLPSVPLVEAARPLRAGGYHIHYDIMDDWEEFHRLGEASWYSSAIEREMVMLSDTVSAISAPLAAKFARLRRDIAEVRNGYDPIALGGRQFAAARAPLEHPKTVGYFGHLSDAWFDWEALYEAAKKLPDVQWELLGYGLSDRSRARLAGFANIRFSGLVAQSDLHRYAQKWWAGMIPFRPCALSAAVDPLKVYEYLHFGLPVVVTGVSGIAEYPLVDFAADRNAFVSAVDRVQERPDESSLAKADEFLKASTWGARLDQLLSLAAEPAGFASLYAR